jgi:hypothetical protein
MILIKPFVSLSLTARLPRAIECLETRVRFKAPRPLQSLRIQMLSTFVSSVSSTGVSLSCLRWYLCWGEPMARSTCESTAPGSTDAQSISADTLNVAWIRCKSHWFASQCSPPRGCFLSSSLPMTAILPAILMTAPDEDPITIRMTNWIDIFRLGLDRS